MSLLNDILKYNIEVNGTVENNTHLRTIVFQ